jgi:hypothetical protein
MFNYIPFVMKLSLYVYKKSWSPEYPTMVRWVIIWWAGLLTVMVIFQYFNSLDIMDPEKKVLMKQ